MPDRQPQLPLHPSVPLLRVLSTRHLVLLVGLGMLLAAVLIAAG